MRVELLSKVIDEDELGGDISALRVGNFGKFPCRIVADPRPVVMATSDAELKAMILDFHI